MAEKKLPMASKAQGLPLNVIIIALIVLVVLVVVWLIFTGKIGLFSSTVGTYEGQPSQIGKGAACSGKTPEATCVATAGCFWNTKGTPAITDDVCQSII